MITWYNVEDFGYSTLAENITDVATSFSVAAGHGARYPLSNFVVYLGNATLGREKILVGTRTADAFSGITRNFDGKGALPFSLGDDVRLPVVKEVVTQMQAAVTIAEAKLQHVTTSAAEMLIGKPSLSIFSHGIIAEAGTTNVVVNPYPTAGWTAGNSGGSTGSIAFAAAGGIPEATLSSISPVTSYPRFTDTNWSPAITGNITVSFEAYSDVSGAKFGLSLTEAGSIKFGTGAFTLTTSWKRYSFTTNTAFNINGAYLGGQLAYWTAGATYHVRRIQIENAAVATSFVPGTRAACDVVVGHDLKVLNSMTVRDALVVGGQVTSSALTVSGNVNGNLSYFNRGTIYGGNDWALKIGSDNTGNTVTDATNKIGRLGCPHYLNAQIPVMMFMASCRATANDILFGGGSSVGNAATNIQFFTAANNTTATGTARLTIDSAGLVTVANDLTVNGDLAVNGGDITSSASIFNIATSAATVNIGGGAVVFQGGTMRAGVSGTTRGAFKAVRGASTNTPGYYYLESPNGTAFYLFVSDTGIIRVHTAIPAANTDGTAVGTQT